MDSGYFKDRLFSAVCYVNYLAQVYNFWAMLIVSIVYEGLCRLRTEGTEKTVVEMPYAICIIDICSDLEMPWRYNDIIYQMYICVILACLYNIHGLCIVWPILSVYLTRTQYISILTHTMCYHY